MKVLYKIIIVLYLIVGIVPTFESIDKVITQWLYLNFLNTILLLIFLIIKIPITKYFLNKTTILFFCLFIWSAITAFFAINSVESIVVLSQLFAIVLGFIVLTICVSKIDKPFNFISNTISIYLIIELIAIYLPFINDIELTQIFSRSSLFLGFAANVNITAFSIIYKVPFFIYSLIQLKRVNYIIMIITSFVLFSLIIFVSGTLNSTRGAILTYSSFVPILFMIGLVIYFKSKQIKFLIVSLTYLSSFFLSFPFNSFLSDSLGRTESNITERISSLSALVDNEEKRDGSLNNRINYYSQAVNFIVKNPIFGTGIGNWKIKSIDTDKDNIVGYVLPYHVHNDYLEIGAEIGIIGLGIYLWILLIGFRDPVINFLKIIFTKEKLDKKYLEWICLSMFVFVFFIDSNINFPFHRPIVYINVMVLLAYLSSKKINEISYEK